MLLVCILWLMPVGEARHLREGMDVGAALAALRNPTEATRVQLVHGLTLVSLLFPAYYLITSWAITVKVWRDGRKRTG